MRKHLLLPVPRPRVISFLFFALLTWFPLNKPCFVLVLQLYCFPFFQLYWGGHPFSVIFFVGLLLLHYLLDHLRGRSFLQQRSSGSYHSFNFKANHLVWTVTEVILHSCKHAFITTNPLSPRHCHICSCSTRTRTPCTRTKTKL